MSDVSGGQPSPGGIVERVLSGYRQFRHLIHEGAKFLIVGATGILVTNILFGPLHTGLGLGVLAANSLATVAAIVVTYLGNRYWSFRDRTGAGTRYETMMFFALNAVGLLIQDAVLGLSAHVLGLNSRLDNYIALNIGIAVGTVFRFWSYRKWIWLTPEAHAAQLNRGRHRRGRPTELPAAEPVLANARRDAGI